MYHVGAILLVDGFWHFSFFHTTFHFMTTLVNNIYIYIYIYAAWSILFYSRVRGFDSSFKPVRR